MDSSREATLAALQAEFPGYRVWLEPTHSQHRYVARRLQPGSGLHTVVTADPVEMRAALAAVTGEPQAAGSQEPAADEAEDAARWQEAARLRKRHPGWVIVGLTPSREFRAYRRLPGARRDTALSAATSGALATAIEQACQRR
jgi:hypothetical protein